MRFWRKSVSMVAAASLALSLMSCASTPRVNLNAEPPKGEAFRAGLKRELSSINIAITASAAELGDTLNRVIPKELYKGSTRTKGLSAAVLRNGPVAVSAADNFLYLTIPISMKLSYGIFETPPLATKLKFKLTARVTQDWRVNGEIYYTGLSDQLVDEVGIGPISIKPRSIVEGITQPVQRLLSDLASKKLNEEFPLRAQVAKVWSAAQQPVLLDKKYNAWLMITPQEVLLNPLYAQNNQVKISVGLRSFAEVVLGPQPPARPPVPLPNLSLVSNLDRSFRVAVNTELFYKDLLNIASPLLLNKDLGQDGKVVILKELDLFGNGDRLIVKVATAGSIDGTFYLTCRPAFNPQTNVFSVEDVDFDLQSKSLLLNTADWFLHGTIKNKIQEKLNMDLTQRLAQGREMAGKAMQRVNLAENVFLTGSVKTVRLNDVMVQRDRIAIQLYAEGESAIALH